MKRAKRVKYMMTQEDQAAFVITPCSTQMYYRIVFLKLI